MTVLCLAELDGVGPDSAGLADASARTLTLARTLARSAGEDLAVAWFGPQTAVGAGDIYSKGVTAGYAIASGQLTGYAPVAWARALAGLAAHTSASAVVAAATDRGSEVLAHLAAMTGEPLAANCVAATRTSAGLLTLVRQRWAGSLLEDAVLEGSPALLTVAADAVPAAEDPAGPDAGFHGATARITAWEPQLEAADVAVLASESAERGGGVSLATARVVIGGGRGVGGPDGFAVLEELAGLLGAAVGVSRVVTSEGWRPHRQQVGQTGTRITPELYLACGISGAIQHMAGCQGAKTIVAINTDPEAPIISRASYAVIGDLHQVLPALIAAIRERAVARTGSGS